MRFNSVIQLISTTYTENELGVQIETDSKPRKVYANRYRVGMQEFFEARRSDLQADRAFELMSMEYQGEGKFMDGDMIFRIYRSDVKGDRTVLYGQAVTADGN